MANIIAGLHFVFWYAPRIHLAHCIQGIQYVLDVWEDYNGDITPNFWGSIRVSYPVYNSVRKLANFIAPNPYKSITGFGK